MGKAAVLVSVQTILENLLTTSAEDPEVRAQVSALSLPLLALISLRGAGCEEYLTEYQDNNPHDRAGCDYYC